MLFSLTLLPALVLAATTTVTQPAATTTKVVTTTQKAVTTLVTSQKPVSTVRTVTTVQPVVITSTIKPVTQTVRATTTVVKGVTVTSPAYTTTIKGSTTTITQQATVTTTIKAAVAAAATTTTKPAAAVAAAPVSTPTNAPTTPNIYPRLIVPVVNGQGAQGTKYFVTVNPTTRSDLLFDISPSSGYKTCTLVGRFPVGGSATSSGAYGSASVQAQLLASNINTGTSAANQPAVKTNLGTHPAGTATNGANAVYASFPVVAGQSYSIVLSAVSGSINLFEDYNAPVVGYTLNCV